MLKKEEFLKKYKISDKELIEIGIDWNDLEEI